MVWVCVDKDGTEKISSGKPYRRRLYRDWETAGLS